MKTTLVLNPKGGAGKTTIATNLASCFAAAEVPTTLMDYDPQGSSLHWLRLRPPHAFPIYCANGAPERRDRLRSFESYVPRETERLIIDAPAGAAGMVLQEMVERAHCIVVPVVPSVIDLHATGNFLRELAAFGRVRSGSVPLAVVANKVRRSMPAYRPLETLLQSRAAQERGACSRIAGQLGSQQLERVLAARLLLAHLPHFRGMTGAELAQQDVSSSNNLPAFERPLDHGTTQGLSPPLAGAVSAVVEVVAGNPVSFS